MLERLQLFDTGAPATQSNRRRARVFIATFLVVAVAGLIWDFTRPAEYRATSRLQITPGSTSVPAATDKAGSESARPFLTEVETLSSRPLIETVVARMRAQGHDLAHLGVDPVLALQSTLTVTPREGTQVVELAAVSPRPELPVALLNGISDAYRDRIATQFKESSTEAIGRAQEETERLRESVTTKRRALDEFARKNDIVSAEREENSLLAEAKGLGTAQKDALERVAVAEGRVAALLAGSGRRGVSAKDDPTLASLELRASQLRESLREMERQFTADYLTLDPNAKAMRSRLAELEKQIAAQRAVGQSNAVAQAEEELVTAREAARRLQGQIAESRQRARQFAVQFAQYRSMVDELKELEKTFQDASQRSARLEATERSRKPALQVLEQAVLPREVWQPQYLRDAAIVIVAAVLLALLAMWLSDQFNRAEPQPAVVVAQPVFAGSIDPAVVQLPSAARAPQLRDTRLDNPRLIGHEASAAADFPRELGDGELAALLRNADRPTRAAIVLLLAGASPQELARLRWSDIDLADGKVQTPAPSPRRLAFDRAALPWLQDAAQGGDGAALLGASDGDAALEQLGSQLMCAAHDGGLDRPHEVTAEAIRHTYIAFLVRQGARFADITRWVGPLPTRLLSAYSELVPTGPRHDEASIERTHPAIRGAVG